MQPLLSFIIPIYNGESCIENCLSAILCDLSFPIEIIMINDGSTDNTKQICDRYAKDNPNIKVIHTKNNGQGVARNIGIDNCKGEYIIFADVDDTVAISGIYDMLKIAQVKSCDIICGTYNRIENTGSILICDELGNGYIDRFGSEDERKRFFMFEDKNGFGYLFNKLFKRSFIIDNNLAFDSERQVFMEDNIFIRKALSYNPKFYFNNTMVYNVDVRFASTTRKDDPNICEKSIKTIESFHSYLVSNDKYEKCLDLLSPLSMRVFCYSLIKNIPYEGLSMSTLYKRIRLFSSSSAYRLILKDKQAYKMLSQLLSFSQKALYKICFFCLKHNSKRLLSLMFFMLYPAFNAYINKNVK